MGNQHITSTSLLLAWIFLTILTSCNYISESLNDYTQYVDPKIGTGGHGHVFIGANVPFGMVQVGPTQLPKSWDYTSGYHVSDTTIAGFGTLHLSGTGIGDLGDISLMPVTGDVRPSEGVAGDYSSGFFSGFDHKNEIVSPGYYKVFLNRYKITAEMTATKRVGFHRYQFPRNKTAKVVLDLESAIGWDSLTSASLFYENDSTISGYRYSTGWAKNQKVYFTAVFSKKITHYESFDKKYAILQFGNLKSESLLIRLSISSVSIDNAKENLHTEVSDWNFEEVLRKAKNSWNKELRKIAIKTNDDTQKRIFYTALYHTMVAPSLFSDSNGDYTGADGKTYNDTNSTHYTTFSLWDTYRAAHPLATIIHPEKMKDYAQSFLSIFEQQGKLPIWHLVGNETYCMVGNPGIPVLADILLKGFSIDSVSALKAMITSALLDERGMKWLKYPGFIPANKETESIAKGLEYAIADWSIAQSAKALKRHDMFLYFLKRSTSFRNYFDKRSRFMRGRLSDSSFVNPFNPFLAKHRDSEYTEGNAWQYTWLVPHNVRGLIELMGGKNAFTAKLDSLFNAKGDLGKEASPDISGLIGQYAHGNEPSHHIAYLYAYAGKQWKTAEKVRQILTTLYHDSADGLSGNEDVGQMSAWYVLSSLGFYQVEPAGGTYVFGSPLFDRAKIKVGENKSFEIIARNNSKKNCYIQKVKLNGQPYFHSYITYKDIMKGGTLEFEMGGSPSVSFGTSANNNPIER